MKRSFFQGDVVSTGGTADVAHCGAGSVPGEESGVDSGEVGHMTQAVSVLGPDVVPVPGIQVGRGVAHVGGANDESFLALLGPAQQDMVAGHGAVIGSGPSEGDRAVLVEGCGQPRGQHVRGVR